MMKIAIDAGHGPNTAGKRCPDDSMREFAFNAAVAYYVREDLVKYSGVSVLFTHAADGSRDVPYRKGGGQQTVGRRISSCPFMQMRPVTGGAMLAESRRLLP